MFSAKILKDSISDYGVRLTTMEVTFPRIVLAEFNTHRVLSRNSASSRAIPVEKIIKRVNEDCFITNFWGKNQKGMQADAELSISEQEEACVIWARARDNAVISAKELIGVGVHKQIANRLLEPFMWQTVIVSATEWDNFFNLRRHKDAQPEIRHIALMMKELYIDSEPLILKENDWHLPLIDNDLDELKELFTQDEIIKICVGRCARVSYLTHDGIRDPKADIELADRLLVSGHMSPFEHAAKPMPSNKFCGNFRGWIQYRKTIINEAIFKDGV